jgi:serine/threonine protein kinase
MNVILFACGPAANESELKASEHLKGRLQAQPGDDQWVLLANLAFSVTHQLQSDEIDLVVIGPTGARVIEIKHWTQQWVESNKDAVEHEADRVTNKARKIGTTLRKSYPDLPRVDGVVLLTQDPSKVKRLSGQEVRGVRFYSLQEWKAAVNIESGRILSPGDIARLGRVLEPKSAVAIDGSLRRLAGYVNLELQTPKSERFHRVYKGSHPSRRDRVVLHLYDLSGSDDKNAEVKSKREFEALHRLQMYAWAPRILDSYQDVPGYAGEMFFFTLVDPAAPSIDERRKDPKWRPTDRVALARSAVAALRQLHAPVPAGDPIVHRNLTPKNILVRHDNAPILTGFERSKIPSEVSVASSGVPDASEQDMLAPEVRSQGFAVADHRSDVFSLCAALHQALEGGDSLCQRANAVLARGMAAQPGDRATLDQLELGLAELLGESVPLPPAPAARFWTEEQVIRFRERDYRILSRLGSGGVGTTFKVVEVDRHTQEDLGTYVAKVAHDGDTGGRVLRAYSLVRSHLRHTGLSTIFEVAREWQENQFIALMTWVSGAPLGDFVGVFSLLAEEQQDASTEALALRWLRVTCDALDVLHRNGLVHGDVSPRNLIVSGSDLVLTDYDFVTKIGEPLNSPGTVLYCSPSYQESRPASPSDDIYALAASFFHVMFEHEPFLHGQEQDKRHGINWDGVSRDDYPVLAAFLDRATSPSGQARFTSVADALDALEVRSLGEVVPGELIQVIRTLPPHGSSGQADTVLPGTEFELREQRIPWLLSLLQSYPGSRWGNRETRGLDTDFASQTYVDTLLEETLFNDIRERRVRLVVLCGNAGDGKTALLQHLAARLGLGRHLSSERILEARLQDGLLLRMNLDGSASWQGRSADQILDEFLAPFQNGPPSDDIVHLLAINDGRLLEWIEGVESGPRGGETPLTTALYTFLQQEAALQESHIRFISLNRRSLVGGISSDRKRIDTEFLERLLDHLYGGDQASSLWAPCQACSAQDRCEVLRATRLFGPETLAAGVLPEVRTRARQRLFEALQAVHLRGETHITVRELRAALVYILFGTHYCDDYHADTATNVSAYWDRTFWVDSFARQGEVLSELARFDPGLEAHPQIDRFLVTRPAADAERTPQHYPELTLESGRRRAFFEWSDRDAEHVGGDAYALDLARGQHLRLFRVLPLDADAAVRTDVCRRLCAGISRLEDLPPQALDRQGVVPLRVTPRTPTETAFWVEKPLSAFRVEADLPLETEGIERLHRHAHLVYRYRTGAEERLRLGADLFHLLLELADGYQLGDVSTDDTFAHLSIFVQRLVREDERELLAWNPMQDETLYRVSATIDESSDVPHQRLTITAATGWGAGS